MTDEQITSVPIRCGEPTKRSGFKNKCKRKVHEEGCKCHSHRLKGNPGFAGVSKKPKAAANHNYS